MPQFSLEEETSDKVKAIIKPGCVDHIMTVMTCGLGLICRSVDKVTVRKDGTCKISKQGLCGWKKKIKLEGDKSVVGADIALNLGGSNSGTTVRPILNLQDGSSYPLSLSSQNFGIEGMRDIVGAINRLLPNRASDMLGQLLSAAAGAQSRPASVLDSMDEETRSRARAWFSQDKDFVAQQLQRHFKDLAPPNTRFTISSGECFSGTLPQDAPELGTRVFLNFLRTLFSHADSDVVDEKTKSFSIPWRYVDCSLLQHVRVKYQEEKIRALRDLGLDSSSDEAMLETHRNNVTTMLTQVVPALQQLDASRGGQPSGSASMGSHAMPYFQPQPQAEGKGAGSYQPGVAPYSLSNAPPPGSMASPPSYPNPLFNQEKK